MGKKYFYWIVLLAAFSFAGCKSNAGLKKTAQKKEIDQLSLMSHYSAGARAKTLENYEAAKQHFEACLILNPELAAAHYELATLAIFAGNLPSALNSVEKAVKYNPSNKWYRMLAAGLYERKGDYPKANQMYQALSDQYPESLEYMYRLAGSFVLMKKAKNALEVLDKTENKMGVNEETSSMKIQIYADNKEYDNASKELEKLIDKFPSESKYYNQLAELYQSIGQEEKAFEVYTRLEEVMPNDPMMHLFKAKYYKTKGDHVQAFDQMKKAFYLNSLNIDAKVNIMMSFYRATESDDSLKNQAYELIDILTETHPKDPKSFSVKGDFLYRDQLHLEALDAYQQVLALDESKLVIWEQIIIINSILERPDSMISICNRALEVFPLQPLFYYYKGLAYSQNKGYQKALDELNKALEMNINNRFLDLQILSSLGEAYYRNSNYFESDTAFDKALEIDSNNVIILNNYSYYLSLQNRALKKAEKMSKKSLQIETQSATFMDTYAWIQYKLANYAEAKIWIEKAIDSGGAQSGEVIEHYGDILFKLNDKEAALRKWNTAKELGGGSIFLDKKIQERQIVE